MRRKGLKKGFSLVEMLVVLLIFSIVGVIVGRSLAFSLRSSKKSENASVVKENVEYALATMERLLRNAKSIDCQSPSGELRYVDNDDNNKAFVCQREKLSLRLGEVGSPLVDLTSSDVEILNCFSVFEIDYSSCESGGPARWVNITIKASRKDVPQTENVQIEMKTRILLRNY